MLRIAVIFSALLCLQRVVAGESFTAAAVPLKIATLEYPPYIINGAEGPHGPVVDLVNAVFQRLKQPVQIAFYPIARGQAKLQQGEVDAFFSIKDSAARRQTMLFTTEPLFSQQIVFFVRRQSPLNFDGTLQSMTPAHIGIVDKTSYGPRLDQAFKDRVFPSVELVVDHETNFKKLLLGRVDAVPCSRMVGLYYLDKLGAQKQVVVSGAVIDTVTSYLVFTRQRDLSALAARFDLSLKQVKAGESARKVWARYNMSPQ